MSNLMKGLNGMDNRILSQDNAAVFAHFTGAGVHFSRLEGERLLVIKEWSFAASVLARSRVVPTKAHGLWPTWAVLVAVAGAYLDARSKAIALVNLALGVPGIETGALTALNMGLRFSGLAEMVRTSARRV